jgi:hypothetical protein
MLSSARSQDWDAVGEMELRRRELFDRVLASPGDGKPRGAGDTKRLAAVIQEVLELDREMIRLGEEGRKELMGKMAAIQEGKRARNAYENPGT